MDASYLSFSGPNFISFSLVGCLACAFSLFPFSPQHCIWWLAEWLETWKWQSQTVKFWLSAHLAALEKSVYSLVWEFLGTPTWSGVQDYNHCQAKWGFLRADVVRDWRINIIDRTLALHLVDVGSIPSIPHG